jgi:NTP pyrophosphatase (non-canonical NTP hydrolase)
MGRKQQLALSETQRLIATFVDEHHLSISPEARLLDLTAEVGELAKEVLKGSAYGRQIFQPAADWSGEIADCLFSLVCLANSTDVDLDAALMGALGKYRQRLSKTGDAGSGQ